MDLQPFRDLTGNWREEADAYERDGALVSADVLLRRVADELMEALDQWWMEELKIEEAAEERGQSYDTIQRQVATGKITNVGRKHRPRVRRADLYRKDSMAEGDDRIRDIMTEMLER